VLEERLTKLIDQAMHKARDDRYPLAWLAVGAAAYLMRQSLRHVEAPQRVVIAKGEEVTIALSDPDG
jgi:hypothetical protein